ncbi:MAG: cytochrome c biogenesis protein CcsA [Proteobacteria bacterium]|nr:cytochrome c biogenesis protein CcsA [Pseudomonadota bacterium]
MNMQAAIAVLLYLTSTFLLGTRIYGTSDIYNKTRPIILLCGFVALVLHAHLLYQSIVLSKGLDFGFFNVVSLVGWLVALIVLLTSLYRPLENLLLMLFPIAGLAILLELFIPGERILNESLSTGLRIHIILSICAYSLLMISAFQALMLAVQERLIKAKRAAKVMNTLPPLQVMEDLLIQIIVIGFFLLSLSLASGMMFINDLFAQHLVHKTVLSILAWFIYGILIWGRWSAGWRGKRIIRWTLGGFTALLLAYFGSKFVLELILHRV